MRKEERPSEISKKFLLFIDKVLRKLTNLNFYIPGCNCAFKKNLLKIYLPIPNNYQSYDYWLNKIAIILNSRFINFSSLQYDSINC